ncbi:MAG: hypothetical protein EB015_13060 [Methylocystaceae bacterium]|nr:hypothetical protein [Methylocystaceae bacterium]
MKSSSMTRDANSLRTIQVELFKSCVVIFAILALAFWQSEFALNGIRPQPALNLAIISVFAFGTVKALISNYHLFGEYHALQAMKETWADFDEMERSGDHGGVLRLMRAAEPAKVFSLPTILGPIYEDVMGEMLKTRALRASLTQRNTLIATISEGIKSERSLVNYITGTLILMGLIGTFIGLMEMVASVGGIIGGLNEAGTGSEDAIKNVLRDLQAPLTGMATGFSASLFGLFGSLSLGLIARFGTTAANSIKREFETWLSRISNLEAQGTGSAGAVGTVDGTTVAIAGSLLGAFRTTQGLITRSAEVMKRLGERQETQTEVLAKLVEQVEGLSIRQGQTLTQLKRVDMIGDALDSMREEAILRDRAASNRLAEGIGRVSQVIENSRIDLFDAVQNVAEQVRGTERLGHVLELQQNRGFEAIALELSTIAAAGNERGRIYSEHHSEVEKLIRTSLRPLDVGTVSDQLAASVDERLAAGFGAVAASFDESLNRLVSGLDRLGQTQAELADRLLAVDAATTPVEEMRAFGKNIEQGVASGLAEIAKVLEGVLSDRARQVNEQVDAASKANTTDDAIADSFELNKIVVEAVLDRFRKKSKNIRSAS